MAALTGLAAAEVQERAIGLKEHQEWLATVDIARRQLPADGSTVPLQEYLGQVMAQGHVDLLDAKRALSHLRAGHEAAYKFGEGVWRPTSR